MNMKVLAIAMVFAILAVLTETGHACNEPCLEECNGRVKTYTDHFNCISECKCSRKRSDDISPGLLLKRILQQRRLANRLW